MALSAQSNFYNQTAPCEMYTAMYVDKRPVSHIFQSFSDGGKFIDLDTLAACFAQGVYFLFSDDMCPFGGFKFESIEGLPADYQRRQHKCKKAVYQGVIDSHPMILAAVSSNEDAIFMQVKGVAVTKGGMRPASRKRERGREGE